MHDRRQFLGAALGAGAALMAPRLAVTNPGLDMPREAEVAVCSVTRLEMELAS
jgi:hypothetical protein